MSAQNIELLNELCETQALNEQLLEAIRDFHEKREAVEKSQSDAFGHQSKRVQRRQHELEGARQHLYSFLDGEQTSR